MKLHVRGSGNQVHLGSNLSTSGLMLVVDGDRNRVEVGDHCGGGGCLALRGEGNRLLIGDRTYFIGVHLLLVSGGCRLVIGNGCVFSEGVDIRTTDSHFIYEQASDRCVNPDADVVLGDRVWLGKNVTVLKGSRIGSDTVVATGAIVAGELPANVIAAGVPARVIREGVYWEPWPRPLTENDQR